MTSLPLNNANDIIILYLKPSNSLKFPNIDCIFLFSDHCIFNLYHNEWKPDPLLIKYSINKINQIIYQDTK